MNPSEGKNIWFPELPHYIKLNVQFSTKIVRHVKKKCDLHTGKKEKKKSRQQNLPMRRTKCQI